MSTPVRGRRRVDLRGDRRDSRNLGHVAATVQQLVVDPAIGLLQAFLQADVRFPTDLAGEPSVVAVTSPHALRRRQVVTATKGDPSDLLDNVDKLVDRDELRAAEIRGSP
jgi:hypothetical protein